MTAKPHQITARRNPNAQAVPPKRDWLTPVLLLALMLITLVAFWPAMGAEFLNWDDGVAVVSNPNIADLSPDHLRWMFTAGLLGHYQPLVWISFAINEAISGPSPTAFHLTNVLLHMINVALVFLLVRKLAAC